MAETANGDAPTQPAEAVGEAAGQEMGEQHAPSSSDLGQPLTEAPAIIELVGFDEPFPVETPPTQALPVEIPPVAITPAGTPPVEVLPVEPLPAEGPPAEGLPVETLPAEVRPVEPPVVVMQRPMRRRFLPPVANGGRVVEQPMLYDDRPRRLEAPRFSEAIEPAPITHPPVEPGISSEPAATAPLDPVQPAPVAARGNRRRLVLLGALLVALIAVVALSLRPKPGDAEAELAQAIKYAQGEGTKQDYTAAAKWFRAAADRGLPRAQYDLGVLYERGRGVPLDYGRAVMWYKRAADGKHPLAEYNLAVAYSKGEGLERNLFEAAVWYNRAALQGVVAAMVNLAILYERGEGVAVSPAGAYAWYRAAARRGSQPAARRADELLQAFSAWDQTQAEAKTREVALSIQDSVGESTRATAATQAKPATTDDGAASNFRSGFDKVPAPAPAPTTAPTTAPMTAPAQPADGGDVNP